MKTLPSPDLVYSEWHAITMMHAMLGFTPDFHVGLQYDADVCHAPMDMCGLAVRRKVALFT